VSYIAAIEVALPEHCHSQQMFTEFYQNLTDDEDTRRKIKVIAGKSEIQKRYSVIEDFSLPPSEFNFFSQDKSLEPQLLLSERMALYKKHAAALSVKAVNKIQGIDRIKKSITHIITVTCTGLFAPGLDIELIRELDLNPSITRSSINFMGCNAAILALHTADAYCKSQPDAKVLVVCTELCTLHFQKKFNEDYILSNLLFADGSAAVLVTSQEPSMPFIQGLKITSFNSLILHKGFDSMAWQISETGFIMNLNSYVSVLIKDNIRSMLDSIGLDPDKNDLWAIHPGGKKIIDNFSEALNLDKIRLKESYDVLRNYGNMSSPTVLFVLKQVIENNIRVSGATILAAAFGPGLSIEMMHMRYD
jgi:predicted naringenin-chalcone synthase